MIVLDTNVVSEAMKASPDPAVSAWLDAQAAETLYLSAVSVAEMGFGIAVLPASRRKRALAQALEGVMGLFQGRVLAFDAPAAQLYADLAAKARRVGKGLPTADGYIAAIADAQGFSVATRDIGPFQAAGLHVINPWCASTDQ